MNHRKRKLKFIILYLSQVLKLTFFASIVILFILTVLPFILYKGSEKDELSDGENSPKTAASLQQTAVAIILSDCRKLFILFNATKKKTFNTNVSELNIYFFIL